VLRDVTLMEKYTGCLVRKCCEWILQS